MPIKKRGTKTKARRITPDALDAYRAGDRMTLHKALGLKPWEINPLDADSETSPYPPATAGHQTWPAARELRLALEATCKPASKARTVSVRR